MPINAGDMTHKVIVYNLVETKDNYNVGVQSWVFNSRRWAAIEPLTGRNFFAAQQVNADISHLIKMRASPDFILEPLRNRIAWVKRGKVWVFNIIAPSNIKTRDNEYAVYAQQMTGSIQNVPLRNDDGNVVVNDSLAPIFIS